ncbi:hypothetical protein NDU88_004139, partial [Pleurodeles waltl]
NTPPWMQRSPLPCTQVIGSNILSVCCVEGGSTPDLSEWKQVNSILGVNIIYTPK